MAERAAEARRRIAAYPAGTFAPFSAEAWTGTDYEGVFACLRWPSPARPDPPDPPGAAYPDVPTLVLNGDLDTITASSGAREVARRFPEATFVELANSFHVTALYDTDGCASVIYARFVRSLDPEDTSCAGEIGEVNVVPSFAEADPASSAAGDESTRDDRRLAAAAALTAADVVARWIVNYDGTSVGLRGGRWTYAGYPNVRFSLTNVQLFPGVRVSGTVRWAYRGGAVRATRGRPRRRRHRGDAGHRLPQGAGATATLTGTVGGRELRATMPAP